VTGESGEMHPWRQLQDDLWATALTIIAKAKRMRELDKEVTLLDESSSPGAPFGYRTAFRAAWSERARGDHSRVMESAIQEKQEDSSDYTTKCGRHCDPVSARWTVGQVGQVKVVRVTATESSNR